MNLSKHMLSLSALMVCGGAVAGTANPVAECRDASLEQMTAVELRDVLSAAGGKDCEVRPAAWGESVACQGTRPGSRAFGLPVREFSAEVQSESGKRTVQIVTDNSLARVQGVVHEDEAADNLQLGTEQDAAGVTVISCIAMGPEMDTGDEEEDQLASADRDGSFEDQ